ncbi:MAG TPA: hypothetical protein VN914_11075 [Polyangia bacterium]|nr:hypothetical protein [Polyangia bacterium]
MRRAIALVVVAAMLSACGTTLVTTNDPGARIYVDGQMVGKGAGSVRMRGLPGSAQVLVTTDDGRRQQQSISRSFGIVTFLLGFITYGVCWLACWEYPGAVMVNVPAPGGGYAAGGPANPGAPPADPWLQPPPGWQPHDAPAAPK